MDSSSFVSKGTKLRNECTYIKVIGGLRKNKNIRFVSDNYLK
jgi:hypothetical protein